MVKAAQYWEREAKRLERELRNPATCCRSGPAICRFVLCRNNGATTPARNHYVQANELIIDRLSTFLHLLIRQTDRSTSSASHLIPIARTLIKVHR